jgi:hypothetical protein
MTLTTHALIGAAVGKYVHNPWLQVLILIPLHYIMDIFRHGEYLNKKSTFRNTAWKVLLDIFAGLAIIFLSARLMHLDRVIILSMFTGAFISMFPDLLTVLYWKLHFKFLKKIYDFHQFVHRRFADAAKEREWNLRNSRNDIIFSILAIMLLLL